MPIPFLVALALAASTACHSARAQTPGPDDAPSLPPNVAVSLGGKVHADARAFPGGPLGDAPGFLLRRARFEVEIEVDGRFRAVVEPGLGEGDVELVDGYAEADVWSGPSLLALRVGRFKTPVGYESLRSSSDLRFAERALPTALSPRRDLGAMLAWAGDHIEAQAGLFNGVPDGASRSADWGSGPDAAARVFVRPGGRFGGLGIGLGAALGTERGTAGAPGLDDYETSGDRPVFAYLPTVHADGARLRLAPQATLGVGRLSLLGEWTMAQHRLASPRASSGGPSSFESQSVTVRHQAWQLAASAVLIGRPQGGDRPVPHRSWSEGGPGAVEVSVRVHRLAMDGDAAPLAAPGSARRATAFGVALHWAPVAPARLGVTAERTAFAAFGLDDAPPPETFVALRAQLDF